MLVKEDQNMPDKENLLLLAIKEVQEQELDFHQDPLPLPLKLQHQSLHQSLPQLNLLFNLLHPLLLLQSPLHLLD